MNHAWFKDTDFTKLMKKEVTPPYLPDQKIDHVEPEFLSKDVKDANI